MYPKHRAKQTPADSDQKTRVFIGQTVRDAAGLNASPGAVAMQGPRVIAAGPVDTVLAAAPNAEHIQRPDALLLPGLINAHAHLDLTTLGHRPYPGSFTDWVQMIIEHRQTADDPAESVQQGAQLSLDAGVVTVGDIAGSPQSTAALIDSALTGVSFIELFGIGIDFVPPKFDLVEQLTHYDDLEDSRAVRVGLQPHAPYSAGPRLYQFAAGLNRDESTPICTHLAESPEELQFVAEADGPFRDLLEQLGRWEPAFAGHYAEGLHPINWLLRSDELADPEYVPPAWLLAHCNYIGDRQIQRLVESASSVVYCPRASDYFGHRKHRYRDLIQAGVNVCLGTDSIVCHGSLSILDEMRHLYQRDQTDPTTLLAMATTAGSKALGQNPKAATLTENATPGLIAIEGFAATAADPFTAILSHETAPTIQTLATPLGYVQR